MRGVLPVLSNSKDVSKWGQSISKQLHNSLKALNPFWANRSTKISPRSVGFFSLTSDRSSSAVMTCLFTKWCRTGETDGSNSKAKCKIKCKTSYNHTCLVCKWCENSKIISHNKLQIYLPMTVLCRSSSRAMLLLEPDAAILIAVFLRLFNLFLNLGYLMGSKNQHCEYCNAVLDLMFTSLCHQNCRL